MKINLLNFHVSVFTGSLGNAVTAHGQKACALFTVHGRTLINSVK